ncbi:MAG: Clp protease ClpP, partial [Alistipes sp.]|nr:Clp protease ClpP [Alistipes sp.]
IDPQEMPTDRNVRHFDEEALQELQRRSQLAADEARSHFGPTMTLQREDPSHGETLRTANERAYAEDVKCFQN